jgi:hypothetical protein
MQDSSHQYAQEHQAAEMVSKLSGSSCCGPTLAQQHMPCCVLQFKRPTPSISTLLGSVPAIHGKLPPLRASADCEAGEASLDG